MKIYLAHPITGMTPEQVLTYYGNMEQMLRSMDYEVLQPMTAKGYFRIKKNEFGATQEAYEKEGFKNPVSTNHAIFERDKWMVSNADVVLVDLEGSMSVSMGCTMELAWASLLGKHTIVVMGDGNPHIHAFILEAADIVLPTLGEALTYLRKLAKQEL